MFGNRPRIENFEQQIFDVVVDAIGSAYKGNQDKFTELKERNIKYLNDLLELSRITLNKQEVEKQITKIKETGYYTGIEGFISELNEKGLKDHKDDFIGAYNEDFHNFAKMIYDLRTNDFSKYLNMPIDLNENDIAFFLNTLYDDLYDFLEVAIKPSKNYEELVKNTKQVLNIPQNPLDAFFQMLMGGMDDSDDFDDDFE